MAVNLCGAAALRAQIKSEGNAPGRVTPTVHTSRQVSNAPPLSVGAPQRPSAPFSPLPSLSPTPSVLLSPHQRHSAPLSATTRPTAHVPPYAPPPHAPPLTYPSPPPPRAQRLFSARHYSLAWRPSVGLPPGSSSCRPRAMSHLTRFPSTASLPRRTWARRVPRMRCVQPLMGAVMLIIKGHHLFCLYMCIRYTCTSITPVSSPQDDGPHTGLSLKDLKGKLAKKTIASVAEEALMSAEGACDRWVGGGG